MRNFKIGDRVKLVDNDASSSHHIGDVGTIIDIDYSSSDRYPYGYLIEVNGYYSRSSTWSYALDLRHISPENLNPKTKVI